MIRTRRYIPYAAMVLAVTPIVVLLCVPAAGAVDVSIQSFDASGTLVFSEAIGAVRYHVEVDVGEGWTEVRDYAPSGSGAVTASVSVVEAWMLVRVRANYEGEYLVVDLSGGAEAAEYPVSGLWEPPFGGWTEEYRTSKLVMRRIPAGAFVMGSPERELGRRSNETQREVTLTQDLLIGVFEVTQEQWYRIMGGWPSYFSNPAHRASRPVETVSYEDIRGAAAGAEWPASDGVDAESFLGRLRQKTGLSNLDLPTEAQWEYACRAGTVTALNSGRDLVREDRDPFMDEVGRYWYNGGSGFTKEADVTAATARVGSHAPNAWGLYDMHGNAWEWCLDWYGVYPGAEVDPRGAMSGSDRVLRGGGWHLPAGNCRSAYRYHTLPATRNAGLIGFRIARTLP